jgi:ribonuclease BN (tRNA processing enzyme)
MKITFLGTNGWFNTKTGNTICTLVETKDYYIVFDAGDGIQKLSKLATGNKPVYLFMSHLHVDHVTGLHILSLFKFKKVLNIILPKGRKKYLLKFINPPFTANVKFFNYPVNISELSEGKHAVPFSVTAKKLKHIWGSFGYRLEIDGKSVVYCVDTGPCENSIKLAQGADMLIHECSMKPGVSAGAWGHANPQEAAKIAKHAGVKKLILTHFDAAQYTSWNDRKMAEFKAKKIFKNTMAVKDGKMIIL